MNNLKVWTFHPVSRNSILYVLFSLFFLVLQKSLQANLPFLNLVFLKKILIDEWFVVLAALPTIWLLLRHRLNSKYYFAFLSTLIVFRSLESLILNFNKVIMVILFIQICMSYLIYQLISWTFSRSIFNSNYPIDQLNQPMSLKIPVQVIAGTKVFEGHLTNWDSQGVFIYLQEAWSGKRRDIKVDIHFRGHQFGGTGKVVTATWDRMGIGLEWREKKKSGHLSWDALIELFEDFGWDPQLLR